MWRLWTLQERILSAGEDPNRLQFQLTDGILSYASYLNFTSIMPATKEAFTKARYSNSTNRIPKIRLPRMVSLFVFLCDTAAAGQNGQCEPCTIIIRAGGWENVRLHLEGAEVLHNLEGDR